MTDAEANRELEPMAIECDDPDRPFRRAIRHALQAIADRVALVAALANACAIVDPAAYPHTVAWLDVIDAARRHMEGRE